MGCYKSPDALTHVRSSLTGKARDEEMRKMYQPDPEAGKRNIHQPQG